MTGKKRAIKGEIVWKYLFPMSSQSDSRLNHIFVILKLNIDKIKILKLLSNFQDHLKPLDGCGAEPRF